MIGAEAHVGPVDVELIQPVDGPSVYKEWLEEHGEGVRGRRCLHISAVPCASLLLEQLKGLVCNHGLDQANDQGSRRYLPSACTFLATKVKVREKGDFDAVAGVVLRQDG
jgi:hypothetical protein